MDSNSAEYTRSSPPIPGKHGSRAVYIGGNRGKKILKKKAQDHPVIDSHGNVLSDIYGDVHRDANGYVIIGVDGVIRDALGYVVKNDFGLPLIAKLDFITLSNNKEKILKEKIKRDEIYFNTNDEVSHDIHGVVKRDKLGNVIIGPEGIIRDSKGFALYNKEGRVLRKGKDHLYNKSSKVDPANLPIHREMSLSKNKWSKYINKELSGGNQIKNLIDLCIKAPSGKVLDPYLKIYIDADSEEGKKYKTFHKKCLLEKKISEFTKEDKEIMNQLLNIKIPEGYYPQENLVVKDLLDPGNKIMPDINKVLLGIAPSFFIQNNPAAKIISGILSLILSDVIPYPRLKKYLIEEILHIIKKGRQRGSFLYAKIMLSLFKEKSKSIGFFKSVPITTVLPIILGSFALYAGTKKNIHSSLNTSIAAFLAKTDVKIVFTNNSPVNQARVYLENTGILAKGANTIKLADLGLYDEYVAKLNATSGIKVELNPYRKDTPLEVKMTMKIPYLRNTEKIIVGNIGIVKTDEDLKSIKVLKKADIEKFINEFKDNKEKYYETLKYTKKIQDLHLFQEITKLSLEELYKNKEKNEKDIKAYELGPVKIREHLANGKHADTIIRDFNADNDGANLPVESIKRLVNTEELRMNLDFVGFNMAEDEEEAKKIINEIGVSDDFLTSINKYLNDLDDAIYNLNIAQKDLYNSNLKNINLIILKIKDTESVLNHTFERIRKYDTKNPLDFFKIPLPSARGPLPQLAPTMTRSAVGGSVHF